MYLSRCVLHLMGAVAVFAVCLTPGRALAQTPGSSSEIEALKREVQRLLERTQKLEQNQGQPAAPAAAPPTMPSPSGEREITLGKEAVPGPLGLPGPDLLGVKLGGFFVGSASWASHIQMVPEFAGGAPALSDAKSVNFRYDKFGLSASKVFSPWLTASAAMEVERHRDRHAHGFDPVFGCPGSGLCVERFGSEEPETEVNLDALNITLVAPIGNGLAFSFGRFDLPFGMERHDEPLNLTATTSEVFRFGRPQRMTGFQAAYPFGPWIDAAVWAVNRWESETTHEPFDDNNKDKSLGGRIGFTPLHGGSRLNFGLGGFIGPERDGKSTDKRWVVDADFTWEPAPRWLFAGEFVYGGESNLSIRERGLPYADPARTGNVNWWGFYLLANHDINDWLGVTIRYGYFNDPDGARTGVEQTLQSLSIAPIFKLSRLNPDLRPAGAVYPRTGRYIDWLAIKLEYRLNWSDRRVFSDEDPALPIPNASRTSHEIQMQFNVNF